MRKHITQLIMFILLVLEATPAFSFASPQWESDLYPTSDPGTYIGIGASPGSVDGYDGQTPRNIAGFSGVALLLYRQNGANWTGQTGFYAIDFESPIPDGGSKTWSDIYLWAQNYTPVLGDRVEVVHGIEGTGFPPFGYTGKLVLDYVPESLNWTEPMEIDLDMMQGRRFMLPVPIATNPYDPSQVVRMHLTVTTPVPEPSTFLAFAAGLPLVAVRRRRR